MADTQQPFAEEVLTKTPVPKQKNPKRVAAGKAIAERMRIAREAQKKALIEAQSIIANNQPKADPPAPPPVSVEPPPDATKKNVLTTTQWLTVFSIIVSLAGIYYKHEEIKGVFAKKAPPSPVMPRAPPLETSRNIRNMD